MLHLAERLGNCTANPIGCLPGDVTRGAENQPAADVPLAAEGLYVDYRD
jgi:hypothetical protein